MYAEYIFINKLPEKVKNVNTQDVASHKLKIIQSSGSMWKFSVPSA